MQDTHELKQHPNYWKLHKQIWENEFNSLDLDIAQAVMGNPMGAEAIQLEKTVILKIKDSFHKKI